MVMEDGLVELLNRLKANGYIRGIGTNRTNTMDRVIMDYDLESHFDMVVTAADVENPKPAPDQLNKIMAEFELSPREILFVGDSEYDQKAAQTADTLFMAFKQAGLDAHFHVRSMEDRHLALRNDLATTRSEPEQGAETAHYARQDQAFRPMAGFTG